MANWPANVLDRALCIDSCSFFCFNHRLVEEKKRGMFCTAVRSVEKKTKTLCGVY